MSSRILTLVLLLGLGNSALVFMSQMDALHLPGNQQGYEPPQPIAFSHRLHAGELQVSCLYCHYGAEKSRHAGIPAASVCINCHQFVTAPLGALRAEDDLAKKEGRRPRRIVSPELQKLYDALALDGNLARDPGKALMPIAWNRVHTLPDFAYFDHRPHVNAEVSCQQCHGPVETMEQVRQEQNLTMGWCVNCHRDANRTGVAERKVNASLDCQVCHH